MIPLPMNDIIETNLYFSAFLFAASALVLLAKYLLSWKSEFISILVWVFCNVITAAGAAFLTGHIGAVLVGLTFNLLLLLLYKSFIPVISFFGLFFLTTMGTPTLFGISWLFQLTKTLLSSLQLAWPLFILVSLTASIFAILIFINAVIVSCIGIVRFSDLYFHFPRRNAAWKRALASRNYFPWVSIHVPCYSEPPEIVINTLNALARMPYPHFEVIVLDNNTRDPHLWKPVLEHCNKLGERFRFFHIDPLKGAKAGALNQALQLTDPQVELIAIVDADYEAIPEFLTKIVGFFDNPKTGFVQTCHDYREWEQSLYLSACYYEYAMHFKLDLPGQSEWDTAYTVGTMCILRRKALEQAGGWAEWCLTEDSEVAVRLHALGYEGYYLKDTFGRGLIPLTFEDYKLQRFRWTAGPVQQFQKHWRLYLPWNHTNHLTFKQKIAEIFHSLSILFSESQFFLMALPITLICLWLSLVKGISLIIPPAVWCLVVAIMFRNIICNWIRNRLINGNQCSFFFTTLAARSLIYTRLRAFYMALFTKNLEWKRTDKFKKNHNHWRVFNSCRAEIGFGILYLLLFAGLLPYGNYQQPDFICLALLGLLNQSVSYLCAPLMAWLSERDLPKEEKKINGIENSSSLLSNLTIKVPEKEFEHSELEQ